MTADVCKVWAAQAVIRVAELARAGCRFVTRRHITDVPAPRPRPFDWEVDG